MAVPRIERAERDGRTVWIKRFGDNNRRLRMAMLRWIARRLGANALLAPIPLTATAACATEAAMIQRLSALGVRVPMIVASSATELVLSDLGEVLPLKLRGHSLSERLRVLDLAFAALLDLHRRGGYVSQAVARNLTLDGDAIGFIDLEEDPGTMMAVPAAQARDLLLFVYSTARFFGDAREGLQQRLIDHLRQESPEVRDELRVAVHGLRWLVPLAKPFGARARALSLGLDALLAGTAKA